MCVSGRCGCRNEPGYGISTKVPHTKEQCLVELNAGYGHVSVELEEITATFARAGWWGVACWLIREAFATIGATYLLVSAIEYHHNGHWWPFV